MISKKLKILRNSKDSLKYLILAWLMIGGIFIWLFTFTYANNFEKLSFYYNDSDVYEIDARVFGYGSLEGDHYIMSFPLFLYEKHWDVKYFRVFVSGIEDDSNVSLSIVGSTNEDPPSEVFQINDIKLTNGINDIKIPTSNLGYFTVVVDGASKCVLKAAQFRQSINTLSAKNALFAMVLSAALYISLSLVVYNVIGKKRRQQL